MYDPLVIEKTEKYVRQVLEGEGSGHDWWHVYTVWKNAINIGKNEAVDMMVVELAALLHDIADWKFNDEGEGPKVARKWLEKINVDEKIISHVCEIIKNISFKGKDFENKIKTKEGMVVQDADRLDAMGAIGIGRAFAFGGFKKREMYNPNIKFRHNKTIEELKNAEGTTINHFYEKLLLLKDRMNTETGKKLAENRHVFMEQYVKQFLEEWEGKK